MHALGATAIILDDEQVLMTRRRDLPLWVSPGGHMDQGETPEECCVREVKEETGLKVEIERLVGLYALPRVLVGRTRVMTFLFACRVIGGAPRVTDETTAISYWPIERLPVNTPVWHRRYLADTLRENRATCWCALPTPLWVYLIARPFFHLRRCLHRLRGQSGAILWKLGAFVTLFDSEGRVLLVQRRDYPVWNLPGGQVESGEMPWVAAVRETREETGLEIEVRRMTGVYSKPSRRELVLGFEGHIVGGQMVSTDEGVESRYFRVGALPELTLPKHTEHIRDSAAGRAEVVLRVQDTPPGLEVLGFK